MIQQQSEATALRGLREAGEWRRRVPVLRGRRVVLREVQRGDTWALIEALGDPEVTRYITPPPATREGFARFVRWAQAERRAGRYLCFVVVPRATGRAVGVIQVWAIEPGFDVAEWGFALGRAWWGTGLFLEAAELALRFVFETLGTGRLEARSAVVNGRGNQALRKLGAVEEGVLRRCFIVGGERRDHVMWSLLADEWRRTRAVRAGVH
jgi:RimJ/RimL family protein N-acetyltransferase